MCRVSAAASKTLPGPLQPHPKHCQCVLFDRVYKTLRCRLGDGGVPDSSHCRTMTSLSTPLWIVPNNALPLSLSLSPITSVCVLVVYFQGYRANTHTGPSPDRTPSPTGRPPVVPHPESIDFQAAYRGRHSTNAWLAPARIVSRRWGPPRACYRIPYCD